MAIVFISPRQRQRTFLYIIIGVFIFGLIIFAFSVFVLKTRLVPVEQVFTAPKIEVNFEMLTSEKLMTLQLFEGVKQEFDYQARAREGVIESGRIVAVSSEDAFKILEELGFSEIQITELPIGRSNIFNLIELIPEETEEAE